MGYNIKFRVNFKSRYVKYNVYICIGYVFRLFDICFFVKMGVKFYYNGYFFVVVYCVN